MRQITQIDKGSLRKDKPEFSAGDTVRVHVRIKEGEKERIQVFQGTVISRRGAGMGATFTVRKVSGGIGVERVFPLNSPNVARIERVRIGQVRRGKLNYLRDLTGKSARIKEEVGGAKKIAEAEAAADALAAAEAEAKANAELEAKAKAEAKAEAEARKAEAEAAPAADEKSE